MPSKSPRVAAYIPEQLKESFNAFRLERGIKSESQALTAILVEFLGVNPQGIQKVDYSSFVTQEQFSEAISKISDLATSVEKSNSLSDSIGKLSDRLKQLEKQVASLDTSTSKTDIQEVPPIEDKTPGVQIALLKIEENGGQQGESPVIENSSENGSTDSNLPGNSDGLVPLKGVDLARRLKVTPQYLTNNKAKWTEGKFIAWTIEKDGVGWLFNPEDKLYHPVQSSSLMSYSEPPL